MKEFQNLLKNYYIVLSLYNKSISITKVFNHPMLISEEFVLLKKLMYDVCLYIHFLQFIKKEMLKLFIVYATTMSPLHNIMELNTVFVKTSQGM